MIVSGILHFKSLLIRFEKGLDYLIIIYFFSVENDLASQGLIYTHS